MAVFVQGELFKHIEEKDNNNSNESLLNDRKQKFDERILTDEDISLLKNYTLEAYIEDVKQHGIEYTWGGICKYIKQYGENSEGILRVCEFGELYEIGLAIADKQQKKNSGQYYTPNDVANVMSQWLDEVEGENICDVACGTGKLILTYFDFIGRERTCKILEEGRLYLYDMDYSALQVCKTAILVTYGFEYENKINAIHCDFLNMDIRLPDNCKVITNPPYSKFTSIPKNWGCSDVQVSTKELYSSFMEKIILQSKSSVHITPYSFMGGSKFYPLRKLMNDYSGFVVSFDNVPGTIFCGRKHGVFNTNTSNSVRAAITVATSQGTQKGFRISPLIRFKAIERNQLLQNKVLESFIPEKSQIVDKNNTMYAKCFKELSEIFETWCNVSDKTIKHYVRSQGNYTISMPNTCRYYTVASNDKMNRNGQIILNFDDEDIFNYVFCMINSSFAYWYWRIYDGGITYPQGLLLDLPMFFDKLTEDDKEFFKQLTNEMIEKAKDYIVTKNNVGVQENIKYPRIYRDRINQRLLNILKMDVQFSVFDLIHSNMALEVSV